MPYYIVKTDGSALATVEDGTVDSTTTDLTLLGKNYPTYGFYLNQNFVKLLENFSSIDQPSNPLFGQLWYNSNNKTINLYREGSAGNTWKNISLLSSSSNEPSENKQADLWFDETNDQLKIYNGSSWLTIGPQTTTSGLIRIVGLNDFRIQISGTQVFAVDTTGNVSSPLNARLQATNRYGNQNFNTTGTSDYSVWLPANILFDIGNNFNPSTGIFTVPKDGYYRVFSSMTTLGNGTHNARWRLNGSDYGISASTTHDSPIAQCMVASGLIYAVAGQTIALYCSTSATANISYQNSSYSIELVG